MQGRYWVAMLVAGSTVALAANAILSIQPSAAVKSLSASWAANPGGIGIPGLTKTYEARLTNSGVIPVRVSVCDYVTDALATGKSVAHAVERWDGTSGTWQFFWGVPRNEFCKPHGLDISSQSRIRDIWLWPRQSVSTDFVAIQASNGLRLNDRLRFVITPFWDRPDIAVSTPEFIIDERPRESGPFRIRH
jgi:hypothetical protein